MPAKHPPIARLLLSLLVAICSLRAASAAPPWHGPGWPTSWVPAPPPPAVVVQFQFLYASYSALPSPKFCTFDQWVLRHGVADPQRRRWMHMLYMWMEHRRMT